MKKETINTFLKFEKRLKNTDSNKMLYSHFFSLSQHKYLFRKIIKHFLLLIILLFNVFYSN